MSPYLSSAGNRESKQDVTRVTDLKTLSHNIIKEEPLFRQHDISKW